MTINPFSIYESSVLYLVVPVLFFFLGWLKLGIGLFLSLLLLLSAYAFLKKIKYAANCDDSICISKEYYISFIILFLFLLSTGNTGFVGSWGIDIPWRNAIYQDLIRQSWPVVYEYSHSILCYYMTFWLVPAAVTSLLKLDELGSNIVLFLWMYIGFILIFLLLCNVLQPTKQHVILITTLFLFFSGINTLGMIIKSYFLTPSPLIGNFPGREYWSFSDYNISGSDIVLIIRSIYLCIADVYNQFFAIAISTLLFFRFCRYPGLYAFIGLITVPYSPIGFIGVFAVMVLFFLSDTLKNEGVKGKLLFFASSFSATNFTAILSIVPLFYFYYSMNFYASAFISSVHSANSRFLSIPFDKNTWVYIAVLLLCYYLFYFMIYVFLIHNDYKTNSLFYIIVFCLLTFPFFKIGSSADFNFNAAICPYLILFIFVAKFLLNALEESRFGIKELVLVFFLSISMLTPITQIATTLRGAYLNNAASFKWTPWDPKLARDSFRDKDIKSLRNFIVQDYETKTFYVYFAKR